MNNKELVEEIAEQLFNQSVVFFGDLKDLGWNDEYVQYRKESGNCRFYAGQFLQAINDLGYELRRKNEKD